MMPVTSHRFHRPQLLPEVWALVRLCQQHSHSLLHDWFHSQLKYLLRETSPQALGKWPPVCSLCFLQALPASIILSPALESGWEGGLILRVGGPRALSVHCPGEGLRPMGHSPLWGHSIPSGHHRKSENFFSWLGGVSNQVVHQKCLNKGRV